MMVQYLIFMMIVLIYYQKIGNNIYNKYKKLLIMVILLINKINDILFKYKNLLN